MRRLLLLMLVGSCLHRAGAIVIEGQVLMPDGSPASGATVQPRGVDDQPPSEPPLACDALGRFTLGPDVPGARWTKLVAWADAGCAVGVGDQRRGPLLVLRPWRSVAGQVVTADGRPLAHVRVAVDKMTFLERYTYADVAVDDHCWPGAVTSTDEQGRWRLDRVPPWPASIRFRHEQYAEVTRDASFEGLRRLVLPPGGAVAGRVTDPTGHPLPGLTVFAADYYDQDLRSECVTDAAGCYRISGLRRGAALVGLAADGPLVAKTRKVDPIEEGVTTSDVDLVALAGQWLTLTVTDGPGGPPVAGLRANCSLPQGGRHTMVTDARGQGHVRALRGQVYVSSGDTQWHGKPGLTARFSVLGGRPEQSATVALQRPSWLDVRVVGFDGSPQRGAYVAVPRTGARDSTDDEGWIRLPRAAVPRGAALRIWLPGAGGLGFGHEVTAEELGLGRAVVKAPHPEQPRLAIWGRVVDDAGQPIAECQVSMLSTRADGLMASGYQRTDEHGNYRFDGDQAPLAQASVSLSAADYEHRSTELAPRQLTAPTALPDMVLPPPPSGQVSGRVVDSRGRAVVRV